MVSMIFGIVWVVEWGSGLPAFGGLGFDGEMEFFGEFAEAADVAGAFAGGFLGDDFGEVGADGFGIDGAEPVEGAEGVASPPVGGDVPVEAACGDGVGVEFAFGVCEDGDSFNGDGFGDFDDAIGGDAVEGEGGLAADLEGEGGFGSHFGIVWVVEL